MTSPPGVNWMCAHRQTKASGVIARQLAAGKELVRAERIPDETSGLDADRLAFHGGVQLNRGGAGLRELLAGSFHEGVDVGISVVLVVVEERELGDARAHGRVHRFAGGGETPVGVAGSILRGEGAVVN